MGIYAGLGVGQAVTFFIMGAIFAMFTYAASKNMHRVGPPLVDFPEVRN
jgi:hypothetical protein